MTMPNRSYGSLLGRPFALPRRSCWIAQSKNSLRLQWTRYVKCACGLKPKLEESKQCCYNNVQRMIFLLLLLNHVNTQQLGSCCCMLVDYGRLMVGWRSMLFAIAIPKQQKRKKIKNTNHKQHPHSKRYSQFAFAQPHSQHPTCFPSCPLQLALFCGYCLSCWCLFLFLFVLVVVVVVGYCYYYYY